MVYFEPLDWIISASTYKEEFKELVSADDIQKTILSHKIGKTGYVYVIDLKGNVVIHPELPSGNHMQEFGSEASFVREMIEKKNGIISYWWKNPDDSLKRHKKVNYQYLPEVNWIVASSSYMDEIYRPLKFIKIYSILFVITALLLAIGSAYFLSSGIIKPLNKMKEALKQGADGDLSKRIDVTSRDEIYSLALYYNKFIDTIEQYNLELLNREQQLDESNKMFQLVLDTIPVRVFWKDTELKYLGGNRLFLQDAECNTIKDLVGKTDADMPWAKGSSRDCLMGDMHVIETGTSRINFEETLYSRSGRATSLRTTKVPLVGVKGKILGILGIYEDITEEKSAELKIAEQKERFRTLFESSPLGITIMDLEGSYKSVNKTFLDMTGYTTTELIGINSADITPDEYQAQEKLYIEDLVNSHCNSQNDTYEKKIIKRNGGTLPVSMHCWVLRNKDSRPTAIGAFIRDITEEKELIEQKRILEKQLQHTQKMEAVGTLAGGIAHDFNNILGGIIGFGELAKLSLENNEHEQLPEKIDYILSAGNRAKDLVRQILQFSRQSKGELAPMNLIPLLKEVLKLIKATIPATIQIETDFKTRSDQIYADATQIHQVIMNLCTNAYHAMKEKGGVLSVRLQDCIFHDPVMVNNTTLIPGKYIKITVEDTGIGMPREIQNRIFEPYFTTKKSQETGCSSGHQLVERHHPARALQVGHLPPEGPLLQEGTRAIAKGSVLLTDSEQVVISEDQIPGPGGKDGEEPSPKCPDPLDDHLLLSLQPRAAMWKEYPMFAPPRENRKEPVNLSSLAHIPLYGSSPDRKSSPDRPFSAAHSPRKERCTLEGEYRSYSSSKVGRYQ